MTFMSAPQIYLSLPSTWMIRLPIRRWTCLLSGLLFILLAGFITTPGQKPDCPPFPITTDPCATIPSIQENITFVYQMISLVHPSEAPSLQMQLCRLKATLQHLQKDCSVAAGVHNLPPLVWSQCQIPELERLMTSNPCLAGMVLNQLRQLFQSSTTNESTSVSPEAALRLRHLESNCLPFWSQKLKTSSPGGSSSRDTPCHPPSVHSSPTPDTGSDMAAETPPHTCFRLLTELVVGEFRFHEEHPDWITYRAQLRRHIHGICPGLSPPNSGRP